MRSRALWAGDEGLGHGARGHGHEHGRLDLDKAATDEEAADGVHDPAAEQEALSDLLVGEQVGLALAKALLHVTQAVPLLRRRAQGLAEKHDAVGFDGGLAGAGAKDGALDAEDVAQVQVLQQAVGLAEEVSAQLGLQAAGAVAQVEEGRSAHDALGHDPTGHGHRAGARAGTALLLRGVELADGVGGGVRAGKAGRVGVNAGVTET